MIKKTLAGAVIAALAWGGWFLSTHHTETVKDSCKYSADADGIMCDFTWEAN